MKIYYWQQLENLLVIVNTIYAKTVGRSQYNVKNVRWRTNIEVEKIQDVKIV